MNKKMLLCLLVICCCVSSFAQDLVPMHNDKGKFGYGLRGSKDYAIKPKWDEVKPFNEYGIAIVRDGDKYRFIDKKGKSIEDLDEYSLITLLDGTDLFLVAKGGKFTDKPIKTRTTPWSPIAQTFEGTMDYSLKGAKWGLISEDGRIIVEPKYTEISSAKNGFITVRKGAKYGCIDSMGREILPVKYYLFTPYNNQGLAYGLLGKNKYTLFNDKGALLVRESEKTGPFFSFSDMGLGAVEMLSSDDILSRQELWDDSIHVLPFMQLSFNNIPYAYTFNNSNVPFVVTEKGKKKKKEYVLYNLKGQQVIPDGTNITQIFAPSEGICFVKKDGRYGFYNLENHQFIVLDQNRMYYPLRQGYSLSYNNSNNNDYYLVDRNGKKVSESYDMAELEGNVYKVKKGNQYGLMNAKGDLVLPVTQSTINYKDDSKYYAIKSASGWGYCNENGEIIVPQNFRNVAYIGNDYFLVMDSNMREFIVGLDGKPLLSETYTKICGNLDENGKLHVWVLNGDLFSKVENIEQIITNPTTKPTLSPTNFTEMILSRGSKTISNVEVNMLSSNTKKKKKRDAMVQETINKTINKANNDAPTVLEPMWEIDLDAQNAAIQKAIAEAREKVQATQKDSKYTPDVKSSAEKIYTDLCGILVKDRNGLYGYIAGDDMVVQPGVGVAELGNLLTYMNTNDIHSVDATTARIISKRIAVNKMLPPKLEDVVQESFWDF